MFLLLFLSFMPNLNTQQRTCNKELINQIYLNKNFSSSLIRDSDFFLNNVKSLSRLNKKNLYFSTKEIIYSCATAHFYNKYIFCLPKNYNKSNLYKALFILELFYQSCLILKKNYFMWRKNCNLPCLKNDCELYLIKNATILEFPICLLLMFYEIERFKKYNHYDQTRFHFTLCSCLSTTFKNCPDSQKITLKALSRINQIFKKKQILKEDQLVEYVANIFAPAEEEQISCFSILKKVLFPLKRKS